MSLPRLPRRALLRGAGGLAIGLPLLDIMQPRRARAAAGPRRLVVFFTPNGSNDAKNFMPQGVGGNFTLGSETDPLLPLKDKLLVLSGILGKTATAQGEGDQHGVGMAHALTAIRTAAGPSVDDVATWGGGPSIDQKIGQMLAAPTKFPTLEFGVQTTVGTQGKGTHPFSRMVYKDKLQPVPAMDDPREAWKRLFADLAAPAGGSPGVVIPDLAREQRRSILDFVREDYQRLGARLGARDRQKTDAHLSAVREIEQRLAAAPAMAAAAAGCRRPPEPAAALNPADPKQFPDIGKLQMDILAMTLACDLTRVASLQWSWARSDVAMTWAGVKDSHHDMSHGAASAQLSAVNKWYAQQLAYFANALRSQSEGDSSVLDNSVVWWCSDIAHGPTHSFNNLRVFLLGSCGGYFKTGQHIAFPGTTPVNQLMVTLMRAVGLPTAMQFGDPTIAPGPLAGIG